MRALLDRLIDPLHLLLALACTWLFVSRPWIGMYQSVPESPGVIDLSHVVLGLALLPLGLLYCTACTVAGQEIKEGAAAQWLWSNERASRLFAS